MSRYFPLLTVLIFTFFSNKGIAGAIIPTVNFANDTVGVATLHDFSFVAADSADEALVDYSTFGTGAFDFDISGADSAAVVINGTFVSGYRVTPNNIAKTIAIDSLTFGPDDTVAISGLIVINDQDAETQDVTVRTRREGGTVDSGSMPKTLVHGAAVAITLTPDDTSVTADETVPYTSMARDVYGNQWNFTVSTTFSTADPSGYFDSNVYWAGQEGNWIQMGDYNGLVDTATVTVTHGSAVILTIAPEDTTVASGQTVHYTATAKDSDGNPWNVTGSTIFLTNDPSGNFLDSIYTAGEIGSWIQEGWYGVLGDIAGVTVGPFAHISTTSPAQNELNVPINTNIWVTFDVDMDSITINDSTFVVNARSTGLHDGTITYNGQTKTATLDPFSDFAVGEVVTVVLTTVIKSSQGLPLDSSYVWSFTTQVRNGEGIFTPDSAYPVGDAPHAIIAGDLDGDGDLDLATANFEDHSISVLLNHGDGTFSVDTVSTLYKSFGPSSVFAADLDGDGDLDLVTTSLWIDIVSVLLNGGDGTFSPHSIYPVGDAPMSVFAGDLDGDGDLDLATANDLSDDISVLLNNGDGTFAPHLVYPAGDYPHSIFAGDLDNDGDLDLATANEGSNDVSILFNLREWPVITTISDVGNDQGGQVRISWIGSHYDQPGSSVEIVEYSIWRRIDDYKAEDGREYPPGDWEFIKTVPARGESSYSTISPTLADSTITDGMYWSVFFVSAMTSDPLVYFDSPTDSGYSLDNLAPSTPQGLIASAEDTSINLVWNPIPEEDFRYYAIYRGNESGFEPDASNLMGTTTDTAHFDVEVLIDSTYYYRVSAFDFAGNESKYSDEVSCQMVDVRSGGSMELPKDFSLSQNYPNPFNPITEIKYALPKSCFVRLEIYNTLGQRVAILVDELQQAGYKSAQWDSKSVSGTEVSSDLYFYRLQAGDFVETRKMILLR